MPLEVGLGALRRPRPRRAVGTEGGQRPSLQFVPRLLRRGDGAQAIPTSPACDHTPFARGFALLFIKAGRYMMGRLRRRGGPGEDFCFRNTETHLEVQPGAAAVQTE